MKVPAVPVHTTCCTSGCFTSATALAVTSTWSPAEPVKEIVMVLEPSAVQAVVLPAVKDTVAELPTEDKATNAVRTTSAAALYGRAAVT